jgi:hypothetical protein
LSLDPFVQFKETVLKDSYDLAEEMKIAREARIISQLNAVRTYQNIDEKKAQEEIDKMDKENEKLLAETTAQL